MSSSASVLRLVCEWSSWTLIACFFWFVFFDYLSNLGGCLPKLEPVTWLFWVWMFFFCFFFPTLRWLSSSVCFSYFEGNMSLFSIRLILNQGASRGVIKRLCIVMDRILISFWWTRCMTSLKVTGLWTDLLFVIHDFMMVFPRTNSRGTQYRSFLWLYLFDSTKIHPLFQVRSLTTLKHGLHSARSLHGYSPTGLSGNFVALFRQPEQRLLSAWYDDEDVFRALPTIARCDPNRTAERYLTMEEFIEKSLVFFFLVCILQPTSPFACVTHNMELMSTVPRVRQSNWIRSERYSWSSWNTSPGLSMWPLVKPQTHEDIHVISWKHDLLVEALKLPGSCPFT